MQINNNIVILVYFSFKFATCKLKKTQYIYMIIIFLVNLPWVIISRRLVIPLSAPGKCFDLLLCVYDVLICQHQVQEYPTRWGTPLPLKKESD